MQAVQIVYPNLLLTDSYLQDLDMLDQDHLFRYKGTNDFTSEDGSFLEEVVQ